MALHVTNTLSGEREPFEPADPDDVLLYYCGLTVSDDAHLGHARSWVHVDVICRWLEHLGYGVRHVENFTDVNEKIVARIGEDDLGDTEAEVARHYVGSVVEDMRALNLERAEVYPRVSEHVTEIIDLVEALVEKGYAYESNGSVYFDVTTFEGYGALSNQTIEEVESQGEEAERAEKRHPQDFALWKADGVGPEEVAEHRKSDEPVPGEPPYGQTWDSPWGEGRPGWHVECSAMSMTHLDETIDVHVGGQDLVFPHHENEIAQSEAATGRRFARYWLHTSLLQTGEDKMSSSLENFFTVTDALAAFSASELRMFFTSTAYNQPQTYSEETLSEAVERWERLSRAHERAVGAADSPDAYARVADDALRGAVAEQRAAFEAAMNDDFNTREANAALLELARAVNRHVDECDEYDYRGLADAIEAFEQLGGGVLGYVFAGEAAGDVTLADELVELVLSVRAEEREAGNFDRADELRDRLEALGVTVEDAEGGTTYRLS